MDCGSGGGGLLARALEKVPNTVDSHQLPFLSRNCGDVTMVPSLILVVGDQQCSDCLSDFSFRMHGYLRLVRCISNRRYGLWITAIGFQLFCTSTMFNGIYDYSTSGKTQGVALVATESEHDFGECSLFL